MATKDNKPAAKKKTTPAPRDENGMRRQTYKRFKEGVDYLPIEADEMSAMIGLIQNQQKTMTGRPPKYATLEEFNGVIDAYWNYMNEVNQTGNHLIPDIEGFCCYAGVDRTTLFEWEHNRPLDFANTIKRLKNSIAFCKKQLALHGKIPPIVFATDFNNNHGYTQKQEVVVTPNQPLGQELPREEIINALPQIEDNSDD